MARHSFIQMSKLPNVKGRISYITSKGCTVIKKGEVYESHLFATKDERFKSEPFLEEVKQVYTAHINRHIADPEQQLKVFDKNGVYLPTKKIGKNNPREEEIKADNAASWTKSLTH